MLQANGSPAMDNSLVTADVNTHVKIAIVALLALLLIHWIGIGARM
jgi:hypothetical protein